MTAYSQSSFNVTTAVPHLPSFNSSVPPVKPPCPVNPVSYTMFSTYALLNVLLLPLCIFIIHVGFQRWRRQRLTVSHSDIFTYHMAILNIFGTVGSLLLFLEMQMPHSSVLFTVGHFLFSIILPGHMLMHCLTGLDLYPAAVHPVTYMRPRQTDGARIRNVILGCVWLLLFGVVGGVELTDNSLKLSVFYSVLLCVLFNVTLIAMLFFCLSVIYVLIHPRPGERGGVNDRLDKSKQRALHIILVILVVLFTECVPLLCTFMFYQMRLTSPGFTCYLLDCLMLLTLPGGLILPLLFLHRSGKLKCCRQSMESSG